ncbi:MAG: response regulator [Desulfovibrio sp.]|jgi:signal transduction histidine kinase/CheY-like chemotaxis protein|nr:response regulator [Desulfovibrio sp.]
MPKCKLFTRDGTSVISNPQLLKRYFLVFFATFIAIIFTVIIINTVQQFDDITLLVNSRLGLPVAQRAVALIDGDAFEKLAKTLDPQDPFYEETRLKLLRIKQESGCMYLYAMAPYTDTVHRFIIDGSTEPGEDGFSPLGSEEPLAGYDKAYLRTYTAKTPQFSRTNLQHWGMVISTFVPIFNASGAVVGILGCDFEAESIHDNIQAYMLRQMLFLGIVLMIGLYLYRLLLNAVMKQNLALQEMNQRALAAANAKGAFLARTSHEIRTPMNAIIGMCELARRQPCPPKAQEYIAGIRNAGRNLLGVINDILDFAEIESGALPIHPAPYETASLLHDVLTVARVRAEEKTLELRTDIAPDLPRSLVGDAGRIRQILLNLLSNAVKYTNEGFVKLSAYATPGAGEEVRLTFIVEDSGIGIRREDMPKLFGEFVRIDEKRHIGIEGAGLGLSIVRSLCRAMGGAVAARSEYGKGSAFTAEVTQTVLDRQPAGDIAGTAAQRAERQQASFTAPEAELLVVDDLPANLLVAEGLLAPYRVRVTTCANGREAVDLVRARPFDLVLMDHMMPVMDGMEATRAVRALDDERCRTVPVVALTADAASGMPEMFLKNGFDDVLFKPISPAELDALLRRRLPAAKLRKAPGDMSASADEGLLPRRTPAGGSGQSPDATLRAHGEPRPPQTPAGGSGQSPESSPPRPGRQEDDGRGQASAPGRERGDVPLPSAVPRTALQRTADTGSTREVTELPRIEGVDTALGLARIGGSPGLYLQLLAVFRADAEAALARLAGEPEETAWRTTAEARPAHAPSDRPAHAPSGHPPQTFPERREQSPNASLRAFTTQVHAVKSALANIGADGLSREAALLEKAGKEADRSLIREKLPAFREKLAVLTARVGAALASGPEREAGPVHKADDAERLDPLVAEHLEQVLDALRARDIDAADAALARLQALPLPAALRIAAAETADCILTADFRKAMQTVSGLLERNR